MIDQRVKDQFTIGEEVFFRQNGVIIIGKIASSMQVREQIEDGSISVSYQIASNPVTVNIDWIGRVADYPNLRNEMMICG